MTKKTASYPIGVRVLLMEDAARRRTLERDLVAILEAEQFQEVILPMVDFVDPYRDVMGPRGMKQSYRFTDRDGELVSIRSDFTPMLARVLAPTIEDQSLPLRVFYRGDVIRCEPSRLGHNREFFQLGAEIVGPDSADGDVAAVRLAGMLAKRSGFDPIISCTDVSLVGRLLSSSRLDAADRERAGDAIRDRRVGEIQKFEDGFAPPAFEAILRGVDGTLGPDALAEIVGFEGIAARQIAVRDAVASIEGAVWIFSLDDPSEEQSYYTGLRFRVHVAAHRRPICGGGRYGDLYPRFGAEVSAVGFTLSVDEPEENG